MPVGTFIEDRRTRLSWLESERRDMAATAMYLCTAQNWAGLIEKCVSLIECEAEIRGLQAKSRPAP